MSNFKHVSFSSKNLFETSPASPDRAPGVRAAIDYIQVGRKDY